MLVCGALALAVHARDPAQRSEAGPVRTGRSRSASRRSRRSLLGSVVLSRFDLWPAALVTSARSPRSSPDDDRLGAGVLGLAVAAKIFPAVLAAARRRSGSGGARGRREALSASASSPRSSAACFLPFFVLAPHGVWDSVDRADEPAAADRDARRRRPARRPPGRAGSGSRCGRATARRTWPGRRRTRSPRSRPSSRLLALVGDLGLVRARPGRPRAARRARSPRRSARSSRFGKVLSPQFLIWLSRSCRSSRGRRGLGGERRCSRLALVLTQVWFPFRYWDLVAPLRRAAVVARARPRPRPGRAVRRAASRLRSGRRRAAARSP